MQNEATHLRLRVTPPLVNKAATPPSGGGSGAAAISDLVRSLGRMLEACRLYGVQHPMAGAAMDDAYALLTDRILLSLKEVHLTLADNALTVNGTRFEDSGYCEAIVVKTMQEVGVTNLRFQAGISPDQFVKIVLLLTAKIRQTDAPCLAGRVPPRT
jgi:hypothetical protein